MTHPPAAGRAIPRRIVRGEDRSIALSRIGYRRVEEDDPHAERGML